MFRLSLVSAAALAAAVSSADARHTTAHRHHAHAHHLVVLKPGYHRHGPARGYKFGFVTYRGDPFARDDYFDGSRCYYLHRRDFCVANEIFSGFGP